MDNYFCTKPFENAEFHVQGDLYTCCPQWLDKKIGNYQLDNIRESWNSIAAQEIRSSIIDGSFKYCNKRLCPFIQEKSLPTRDKLIDKYKKIIADHKVTLDELPSEIMLVYDLSCNLTCPSCRTHKTNNLPESTAFNEALNITKKIHDEFLENLGTNYLRLNVTGSGDPFASLVFRQFIENINGEKNPNLKIDFQTNGLLLTPIMWNRLSKIWRNIDRIIVSVDASSEETYQTVRGGNWNTLLENMKFLSSLRKKNQFQFFQVNFIVQNNNYCEMISFAKLFLSLECDAIVFSKLVNWGTWDHDNFLKQIVWDKEHPNFSHFMNILSNKIFHKNKIYLGNLTELRRASLRQKILGQKPVLRPWFCLAEKCAANFSYLQKRNFFLPRYMALKIRVLKNKFI